MQLQIFLTLYAIAVPVFFIIDMVWLGFIARSLYQTKLAHVLGPINWPIALLFYFVFLLGLTYFATYPAVMRGSFTSALILGAMFGFFTYATYDLTNQATLRDWPYLVTIVDILWGTFLGGAVAAGTYLLYIKFF